MSLVVPIVNSLTFIITHIASIVLGEEGGGYSNLFFYFDPL